VPRRNQEQGTQKEEKTMKKQFGKLSKSEREKIETQYHRMSPQDFNERMSRTKRQSPGAIRLPSKLVEILKTLAESEGEPEYQTMVKRWIEERLQQETSTAR
jgi:predicted DNA binding CopG/RHH family protein